MTIDWKKPQVIKKTSNIYHFSKNPLFRRKEFIHIYLPWDDRAENELMYFLKDQLKRERKAFIPYMSLQQFPIVFTQQEREKLQEQLALGLGETYLIMSNLKSFHIFKVENILNAKEINTEMTLPCFSDYAYRDWIKVNDVFVWDVNHLDEEGIEESLNNFIEKEQIQNIFSPSSMEPSKGEEPVQATRWVDKKRSLTYEYFIRSKELKENIFCESWDYLSCEAQHELVCCELERHKAVFLKQHDKWKNLSLAFQLYKKALLKELNDIYVLPFVSVLAHFESMEEAWEILLKNKITPQTCELLKPLVEKEKEQIDCLEDYLKFMQGAKSFFYSIKNHFSKKFHKEEFLILESFLAKQESLVDSFHCKKIKNTIELIMHLDLWVKNNDKQIYQLSAGEINRVSSRLSHLLTKMICTYPQENIFYLLLEEKTGKRIAAISFEDEVMALDMLSFSKVS